MQRRHFVLEYSFDSQDWLWKLDVESAKRLVPKEPSLRTELLSNKKRNEPVFWKIHRNQVDFASRLSSIEFTNVLLSLQRSSKRSLDEEDAKRTVVKSSVLLITLMIKSLSSSWSETSSNTRRQERLWYNLYLMTAGLLFVRRHHRLCSCGKKGPLIDYSFWLWKIHNFQHEKHRSETRKETVSHFPRHVLFRHLENETENAAEYFTSKKLLKHKEFGCKWKCELENRLQRETSRVKLCSSQRFNHQDLTNYCVIPKVSVMMFSTQNFLCWLILRLQSTASRKG